MVTGGYNLGKKYLDSTEMLLEGQTAWEGIDSAIRKKGALYDCSEQQCVLDRLDQSFIKEV